jgi:flagella basal body P-ring formation protein FlgA
VDLRPGHGIFLLCALLLTVQAGQAQAGQFRVWSSAVVVSDLIKLGDLAELRGLESSDEEDSLRDIVITEAPPPGGSRIIHHELIRSALKSKGVNLAKVTLAGAAQCEVRRPAAPPQVVQIQAGVPVVSSLINHHESKDAPSGSHQSASTLRKAIEDHFHREFARYGGHAEVMFDRSDDHVLELTGPLLEFHIRREKSNPLGLCALEIDVIQDGKTAQHIPIVVRTALSRSVLTTRRAVNQGAAVVAADVDLMPVTFTRLDDLGLDDATLAIGQRAKRFIPAGTRIELEMLEPVPLVLRGQLITLISEVGGVRVVTTAKACANGMRGETIRVRSVDDNKIEFDAVVIGPGEARAAGGGETGRESKPRLVLGGTQ